MGSDFFKIFATTNGMKYFADIIALSKPVCCYILKIGWMNFLLKVEVEVMFFIFIILSSKSP